MKSIQSPHGPRVRNAEWPTMKASCEPVTIGHWICYWQFLYCIDICKLPETTKPEAADGSDRIIQMSVKQHKFLEIVMVVW